GVCLPPVCCRNPRADPPAAKVLGATPLKPENSRNTSAGVAISPVSKLDLTIDYYRISIDDRIVLSGNLTGPAIAALLAPFGANGARFFTNAIDTRTAGVDATASYRLTFSSAGDVFLRGGYNNTRTRIVGSGRTAPQVARVAAVLFDRIERRRIECGQPRDSARLGGSWRRRRFGADVNVQRYGSFCSTVSLNPADDQQFGAKWLTDVEASYRAAGYVLAAGGAN